MAFILENSIHRQIKILLHPSRHLLFSPNKRSRCSNSCVSTGPPFTRPFRRPLLLPSPDINGIWLILKESRLMSSPSFPAVVVSQLQLSRMSWTEQRGANEINGGRCKSFGAKPAYERKAWIIMDSSDKYEFPRGEYLIIPRDPLFLFFFFFASISVSSFLSLYPLPRDDHSPSVAG